MASLVLVRWTQIAAGRPLNMHALKMGSVSAWAVESCTRRAEIVGGIRGSEDEHRLNSLQYVTNSLSFTGINEY